MESKSRVNNSIRNSFFAVLSNALVMIVGFIAQRLFLKILTIEYAGINSLYNNIFTVLNLAELGIGNAIIFNLYRPIAENNVEEVNSLMAFYRKCYHVIGVLVCVLGLIISPFLPWIITETHADINIYVAYILCLADPVLSYFLSYKRSLLYVHQQNYIISIIHIGYTFLMNVGQITLLYFTNSYYVYLVVKVVMRFVENYLISYYADKLYGEIDYKSALSLKKETKDDIFKKVRALLYHKIGDFVILSTDNIVISRFLGIMTVGLYANYKMILAGVQTLISQLINALTPSVGNLLVQSGNQKRFEVFRKIKLINYWFVSVSAWCILTGVDSFIKLWLGKEYLLTIDVVVTIVFLYYLTNIRWCIVVFKEAAGIFYEDRFVPFVTAILNLVTSVIFVQLWGLAGVFWGTIVGELVLHLYSFPKYVYSRLFDRSRWKYIAELFLSIVIFVVFSILIYWICNRIIVDNLILNFIVREMVTFISGNLFLIILLRKTDEYQYFKGVVIGKLKGRM